MSAHPAAEDIEAIVIDELAGLGGLGLRVIDSAAESIARKVLTLLEERSTRIGGEFGG